MKKQYVPRTREQKIGYLTEECGEVIAALGKTIRWGLESYNPELPEDQRETNREWVLRELQDLKRAIEYFEDEFGSKIHRLAKRLRDSMNRGGVSADEPHNVREGDEITSKGFSAEDLFLAEDCVRDLSTRVNDEEPAVLNELLKELEDHSLQTVVLVGLGFGVDSEASADELLDLLKKRIANTPTEPGA